jgi:chloramphenicol-sensitive protein RarD
MTNTASRSQWPANGVPQALGAYLAWGVVPIYFNLLRNVTPVELVAWRVLFTLPFCLAIIGLRRQGPALRMALLNRRVLGGLMLSAVLIGCNWLIYIFAVNSGHVLAASLGYYINPLVSVALGMAFLGERLRFQQWLAVGIATSGIALLAWGALDTLWIALSLAASFGIYGLVRKLVPVDAVPGLTIETMVLTPLAGLAAIWFARHGTGSAMLHGGTDPWLLAAAGAVTGVPLLLFAIAARRMDLSMLGFTQFLSPTIGFVIGLTYFHESLSPVRLACFCAIWLAIAVFCHDLLKRGAFRR